MVRFTPLGTRIVEKAHRVLREAEELVALEPANPQFLMQRANLMLNVGRTEDAADEYARLHRDSADNPTVSLEETMVAMQKAQLGFQATLQVRNRLVQAYSDIMNMQV